MKVSIHSNPLLDRAAVLHLQPEGEKDQSVLARLEKDCDIQGFGRDSSNASFLHMQLSMSFVNWHSVDDQLPGTDQTVLIACKSDSEPIWLGYYDDSEEPCWLTCEGFRVEVTHWAAMPTLVK